MTKLKAFIDYTEKEFESYLKIKEELIADYVISMVKGDLEEKEHGFRKGFDCAVQLLQKFEERAEQRLCESPAHHVQLKLKLDTAIWALEFYACHTNWILGDQPEFARSIAAHDCNEVKNYARYCGGEKARLVLKKIRGDQ